MKKSTRGLVAAGAAAVLLAGGAGTLAYWSGEAVADGGSITSGRLALSDVTCDGAWTDGTGAVTQIVPGDTVSKNCTGTLTLEGENIGATVSLTQDSVTAAEAAFNDEVDITARLVDPTGGEVTEPGVHDVTVAITVAFPGEAATNSSWGKVADLDGLQLTARQTHTG